MQLGYITNGLQNHRLDEALRLLAEHGYEAVGLTLDVLHLDPFRCSAAEVAATARLCEELGLQVVVETGARFLLDPRRKHEPTLMSRDPDGRQQRLGFYARAAALGRDLGAQVLSFWAGIDRSPGAASEAWLDEGVARCAELVRGAGLEPALEPEPGMAVETLADYLRLRQRLGDAAPSLSLDLGHLYATREGDPVDCVRRAGPHLRQVHLEDMRWGVHEHLPPGEGDVDFAALTRALREVDYAGSVCFELSRESHRAPQMLALCQATWAALSLT